MSPADDPAPTEEQPKASGGEGAKEQVAAGGKAKRPRRALVITLLVAGTLSSFLGMFAVWVNRQALNTDNWATTSSKLLEDKTIRDAVAVYLVDQLYANVNVANELEDAAPKQLKPLSGPAAAGLQQLALQLSERALENPQVQAKWEDANRVAHQQLLAVINGKTGPVSTQNGKVVLDLRDLVGRIAQQLGIGADVAEKLPAQAGNLVILKSNELDTAQKIARLVRRLAVGLVVLSLLLFGFAVYAARGYHRETLRAVGGCLIIAGIGGLLVRGIGGNAVVDSLATTAAAQPPADHAWSIATELLNEIAVGVIVTGLLLLIASVLGGPTRMAVGFRHASAPYLRHHIAVCYVVVAILLLILIVWQPTVNFGRPGYILLYAVLLAIGVEMLRRQTAKEFPDTAETMPIEGAGEAFERVKGAVSKGMSSVGDSVSKMRGGKGGGGSGDDRLAALERLGDLKEKGVLSAKEFEAEKQKILDGS